MKVPLFLLSFLIVSQFQKPNPKIEEFLQKIEVLIIKEGFNHPEWEISNFYQTKNDVAYSMQFTQGQVFFHPILKVHYAFSEGKIFDPDLNVGIDTKTAVIIDFSTGKEYPLKDFKREEGGFVPKFIFP
ncbi:MAG: hypothetical protein EA341_05325 [Mongoliibacter sp.]|uniref:hypothetical protein n=1 Tax=Mongoliibacter sp. TaxID=2022438 RepID=UPI0012F40063|nr:hypothetical protein [Mongoliibacter sp.]TVP51440.1 MAG: hypothetical protein EA341_05325 [Mongoliibacter sp.]